MYNVYLCSVFFGISFVIYFNKSLYSLNGPRKSHIQIYVTMLCCQKRSRKKIKIIFFFSSFFLKIILQSKIAECICHQNCHLIIGNNTQDFFLLLTKKILVNFQGTKSLKKWNQSRSTGSHISKRSCGSGSFPIFYRIQAGINKILSDILPDPD